MGGASDQHVADPGQGSNLGSKMSHRSMSGKSAKSIISNPISNMSMMTKGKGFDRLKKALEAAAKINKNQYSESYINKIMDDVASNYDLRATIFSGFYRVGFDIHELSPQEK